MELRQLRYFLAVAEELHFGKAAERVFIAQSPLSRQIKQLEDELNVQLFRRTKRSVELTDAGRALIPEAEGILSATRRAKETAVGVQQGRIGQLTIGFTQSATYTLFPRILKQYIAMSPRVELHFREHMLTPEQVLGLTTSRLDLGFLRPPLANPDIELLPVMQEKLVVAVPEESALARKSTIALEDLANENFVTFSKSIDSSLSAAVLGLCHATGFQPRITQEAKEVATIVMLVASGLGVALVPASASAIRQQGAAFRPLAGESPTLTVALAWNRNTRSVARDRFVAVAREIVGALHPGSTALPAPSQMGSQENTSAERSRG